MCKRYEIVDNPTEGYNHLVIMLSVVSAVNILDDILSTINTSSGTLLIDQITRVGNTENRFIILKYVDRKKKSIKYGMINKNNICRKLTCDFLKNWDGLDCSILTSVQKRMIKKGITI